MTVEVKLKEESPLIFKQQLPLFEKPGVELKNLDKDLIYQFLAQGQPGDDIIYISDGKKGGESIENRLVLALANKKKGEALTKEATDAHFSISFIAASNDCKSPGGALGTIEELSHISITKESNDSSYDWDVKQQEQDDCPY